MKWEDLLARNDIKGGQIQIVTKEGVFRSDIMNAPEICGDTIHFKNTWTMKENPQGPEKWVRCNKKTHYFTTTTTRIIGSKTGRVQFDIPGGWVIIFPSGDGALVEPR